MPELPECEANRRRIEAHCLNRTIEAVQLGNDVAHLDLPGPEDRDRLVGRRFTEARRHGKTIFAGSQSGPWIAVHLGMSGSLRPYDAQDAIPDYARIVFAFEGDRRLAFRCPRKFGWVKLIEDPQAYVAEAELGPDALEIDRDTFHSRVGDTRGAIKSALMAQKKLAGVGNLWADETLYQTGIHPETRASDLPRDRIDAVYDTMRDVLSRVADTDAVYSKLPRDWLIANREMGKACPRCEGEITKKTVGGRTAYLCADHQG